MSEGELTLQAKWGSTQQTLQVPRSMTVAQLIDQLKALFGLESCKLIGLVKGKLPAPETTLATLHPAGATVKVSLIGVQGESLAAMGEKESAFEVARLQEEARAAEEARARAEYEAAAAARREVEAAAAAVRAREYEERRRREQAEWEERRRQQEAEQLQRELAAEQNTSNTIVLELQAFHMPALDVSGKILLPPQALQDIVNAKLSFPLTFQCLRPDSVVAVAEAQNSADVQARSRAASSAGAAAAAAAPSAGSNQPHEMDAAGMSLASEATTADSAHPAAESAGPIVSPLVYYSGVQDFTAPQYTVSVPKALLRSLGLTDGAKLRLTNVNLVRATHIVLRPLTRGWSRLPDLERRALLEFQLRKHQFLVQDSELSFSYHPHLPTFRFRVVETRPQPVVSILDADVATEILPFEEAGEADMEDDTTSTAAASSAAAAAAPASSGESQPLAELKAEEPISGHLTASRMARFAFPVSDPNVRVEIELKSTAGDADLYVLSAGDADAQAGVDVDLAWHTWSVQSRSNAKVLTLSAAGAQFSVGALQIGVRAYAADASFTLTVHERAGDDAKSGGYQLGTAASSSAALAAAADGSSVAVPADSTVCPTCKSVISSRALAMHSVQCARLNCVCGACGVTLRTNERDKHMALVHGSYTCLCGVQLQQAAMIEHRRSTCPLRLVPCLYCPLRLVVAERGPHQHECGTQRSLCTQCGDSIQRKIIRRHLVKAHGGINGKTDERDITVMDFWA